MKNAQSPITQAYLRLFELSQDQSLSNIGHEFVLTWLAAAKLITEGQIPGLKSVKQLVELSAWQKLLKAGFPQEAYSPYAHEGAGWEADSIVMRIDAATAVSEMLKEVEIGSWSVLPTLNDPAVRRLGIGFGLPSALAALLLDALNAPVCSEIFIPYDSDGQLTIEAIRRGLRVCWEKPGGWGDILQPRLLLLVETGFFEHPSVRYDAKEIEDSRHDYAVITTPVGRLRKSFEEVINPEKWNARRYTQAECSAITRYVECVDKRAVFLTSQSFLFLRGEEQRVRELLLHRPTDQNEVESVVELPVGVRGSAAGALLTLTPGEHHDSIYLASLGSGRRAQLAVDDILASGRGLVLGRAETEKSKTVTRDEIVANDYSFAPARYLERASDLGFDSVKLIDICDVVRPPSVSREKTHFTVAELGLNDLDQWQPIEHEISKVIYLKAPAKETVLVRPGDIAISIKGTVGRVAVVGTVAEKRPTVVSQSCLALRIKEQGNKALPPEVLLLYLRSPHGQAQLAGLRVGSSVQHINPGTLLSAVSIPVLTESETRSAIQDFKALCKLEVKISEAKDDITEIVGRRWPAELQ